MTSAFSSDAQGRGLVEDRYDKSPLGAGRNGAIGYLLLAGVTLVVAALAFRGGLAELFHRWSTQEEYSHGFLIPFITAWLLWTRRDALRAKMGNPNWIGLALIALALAMGLVGELSAVFLLSQLGFVLALVGIVLAIGGYPLLRLSLIPIAFLLFAIPLPYFIDAMLTLRLQLISSELGVFFIRLFGIPVYLDGNIIDMGDYKLQVVDACSGLRYLYPLMSLSFLAAYLFHAPLWQRIIVFLSSIPIAIGMNGFRIGLVGFLVDRWGNEMAEGVLHMFEGWVIFLACSAILALEMYLLARLSGRNFFDTFYFPNFPEAAAPARFSPTARTFRPLAASLAILALGGLAVYAVSGRQEALPDRTRFVDFPQHLGDWKGRNDSLDIATEKALGFDDYILSDYSEASGRPVNLYVAYYSSQRKGESPHSPLVCIPGSGWAITSIQQLDHIDDKQVEPFNRVIIQKGDNKQIVYYWFDERGRRISNEWAAKFYLLADAIFMNRTDGALVRLTTQVSASETEKDADRRLQAFMQAAVPKLSAFLPDGKQTSSKSASFGISAPQS